MSLPGGDGVAVRGQRGGRLGVRPEPAGDLPRPPLLSSPLRLPGGVQAGPRIRHNKSIFIHWFYSSSRGGSYPWLCFFC